MSDTPAPPPPSPPPPAPPPPAPPPPAPPPPAPPEWVGSLPEELRADANLTRFFRDDPTATVAELGRGYIETKRLVGADKIVLPKGDDDAEGWDAAFAKLGRPEKPEDYVFPTVKEGESSPLADALRPALYQAGLNQRQVALLDTALAEQTQAALTAAETAAAEAETTLRASFVEKHGEAGWKEMETRARTAASALLPPGEDGAAAADEMDKIIGSSRLVVLFDSLGKKMGEGRFLGGDPPDPLVDADPEKQMTALQADADFRAKLEAGDATATRKWAAVKKAIAARKQAS